MARQSFDLYQLSTMPTLIFVLKATLGLPLILALLHLTNADKQTAGECWQDNSKKCEDGESTSVVDKCRQFCICENGKYNNPDICLLGRFYDALTKECLRDSSVCKNTPTNQPKCLNNGGKKVFEGNCKDYWECDSGKWVQKTCNWGYDFDKNNLSCTWSWWAKC